VFPFVKFPGVDTLLGPEMKSTGEVMGIDREFGGAFLKAQRAAGMDLPSGGMALVSVREADKPRVLGALRTLVEEGFQIVATEGTAAFLKENGVDARRINKVAEGEPHTEGLIRRGEVALVIMTTEIGDPIALGDSASTRRAALELGVPYLTTAAGARAAAAAIRELRSGDVHPVALQDLQRG
jgi:carbamoyl-phosphate synthase large subunit